MDLIKPIEAAKHFKHHGRITDIREYGNGNINNTFLVTLDGPEENYFVLQRINTDVFPNPELIIHNMRVITEHINDNLKLRPLDSGRLWIMPGLLQAEKSEDYLLDGDGSFWRATSFIKNASVFDTVNSTALAKEVGYALGMFHNLLSDLDEKRLHDTLEGFHVTPAYLSHYRKILDNTSVSTSGTANYCLKFIEKRSPLVNTLENARGNGKLRLRTIHGDPKVNNIIIDSVTDQAISIVDLDTVKPGLVHYDIGDCLRSACNPLGEETGQWESVKFETDLCESILKSYLSEANDFLDDNDYAYLFEAIRLLPFELGLRFFTDYLDGNTYFKVKHNEHNLQRALVQFKLVESIESQQIILQRMIGGLR